MRSAIHTIAMAAFASLGVGQSAMVETRKGPRVIHKLSTYSYHTTRPDMRSVIASMYVDGTTALATFTSPKSATKRQRRRARGKGKS